jgi:hypothetical protein
MNEKQANNPLHGKTLKSILNELVAHHGWDGLGRRIDIKCFTSDPSIASSLKFLRRTPWAREKVEHLYLRTIPRNSEPLPVVPSPKVPASQHRIFSMPLAKVYPMYVQKAESKGRLKSEVDEIICWLTGYDTAGLAKQIADEADFATFFAQAPALNPNCALIKGVVCGVRVEDVEDPLMQKIRYLDKMIDELAKGKALEKILRT